MGYLQGEIKPFPKLGNWSSLRWVDCFNVNPFKNIRHWGSSSTNTYSRKNNEDKMEGANQVNTAMSVISHLQSRN